MPHTACSTAWLRGLALAVAIEMVGERDERIGELVDTVADMRLVYQQQTEELVTQLMAAKSCPPSPASSTAL